MIPVNVDPVALTNIGFVVFLRSAREAPERVLPIVIGAAEAQSIAMVQQGSQPPRPLTHDLLKNLLDFLECRLLRLEVCDLRDGTFFARLVLERDGERMGLDCRPSDGIALALRVKAPVFVAEKVMTEAGRTAEPQSGMDAPDIGAVAPASPSSPLDALGQALEKAVAEERFEDAARLRDEIRRLRGPEKGN